MKWGEYSQVVLRSESTDFPGHANPEPVVLGLKIVAAAGAILNVYKRKIFYGEKRDRYFELLDSLAAIEGACRALRFFISGAGSDRSVSTSAINMRLLHSVVGTATETGELAETEVKILLGDPLAKHLQNLTEEEGDLSWYRAQRMDVLGLTEEQVQGGNFAKLSTRFPDGHFDSSHALNRDVVKELEDMDIVVEAQKAAEIHNAEMEEKLNKVKASELADMSITGIHRALDIAEISS